MPVRFIVDPDLPPDVKTITLSYTFYKNEALTAQLGTGKASSSPLCGSVALRLHLISTGKDPPWPNRIRDDVYYVPHHSNWPFVGSIAMFTTMVGVASWLNEAAWGKRTFFAGIVMLAPCCSCGSAT